MLYYDIILYNIIKQLNRDPLNVMFHTSVGKRFIEWISV